ncbi:MAG: hypothetical protein NVS3B26_18180 [Mycobacteriales bacterium]
MLGDRDERNRLKTITGEFGNRTASRGKPCDACLRWPEREAEPLLLTRWAGGAGSGAPPCPERGVAIGLTGGAGRRTHPTIPATLAEVLLGLPTCGDVMNISKRALTTAAAVIAMGAVTVYGALPGNAASTIKITSHQTTFGLTQAASRGFNVGDGFAFSDSLKNTSDGSAAGYDAVTCTVVRVINAAKHEGVEQCVGTFRLKNGTITAQGLHWDNGSTTRVAVTGGTGAYEGAKGDILIPGTQGDTNLTITLQ